MQMGVGIKFGFWLSLLGICAIAATAYYAHSEVEAMLLQSAKQRLVTATAVLGRRFTAAVKEAERDVALMSRLEEVDELVRGAGDSEELRFRLAALFTATVELHPEYLQLRLIGADDFGRELVRVDRTEGGTTRVIDAELQEKGHFPYVYRTLAQPPGSFYLSEINLNLERGVRFGLNRPTLRIATPVQDPSAKAAALVIVNVALNDVFMELRADLPREMDLYLANAEGDFLLHPDVQKTFGFDRGRRVRVQDDFEGLATLLESGDGEIVLEDKNRIAAFVNVPFGAIAAQRHVLLGLAVPTSMALQGLDAFEGRLILIVSGFSVLAILLAFFLSRLLIRPLNQVVSAVERFSRGLPPQMPPLSRNDEIGLLSRSFARMAVQIGAQIDTLQVNERDLNRILETAPSGMFIVAREDHRLLFMNTSARERFPNAREGRAFLPIEDGPADGEVGDISLRPDRAGTAEYTEHHLHGHDGEAFWALLAMIDIEYRNQAAVLILVVDITERKEAEIELEQYRNQLESIVQERTSELLVAQREALRNERLAAIGQLTGTVSHELRNPLGTIQSSFTLLRHFVGQVDPKVMRIIDRIERNITRCDKIIQDLLDYTRMRDFSPRPTDLDRWVRQVIEEQELPGFVQVELLLESSARVPIDRDRLAQALINIIQNACQAIDDAQPSLPQARLQVRTRALDDRVEIEVEDNGPGIDPAEQARIFEPLFSTRSFGVGLGLPHVKQVMELHHGGVEVHSHPGSGTRVTLWLPRVAEEHDG